VERRSRWRSASGADWFSNGLRTGYALPLGSADGSNGDEMSNLYSGQVPLLVEVGGKPSSAIFLGGYLGLGFGGTDGATGDCAQRRELVA